MDLGIPDHVEKRTLAVEEKISAAPLENIIEAQPLALNDNLMEIQPIVQAQPIV